MTAREQLDAYATEVLRDEDDLPVAPRSAFAPKAFDAVRAVLDLHQEQRIYRPCGHAHPYDGDLPDGVVDIPDDAPTCQDGYITTICGECCTDTTGYRSEECTDDHTGPCWPCRTVQAIEEALR